MAWWVLVAIVVATTVLAGLLAPRPPGAKPSALGDFQAPTAEEGRIIPVIFGTVKIAGPNVVWYGNLRTEPIKVRSGLFSKTTIGYRYFLGMQLALCHGPIEGVGQIAAGGATAHITCTGTSPFAPNWWVRWDDFLVPGLPEDAVIQKIYAVARASHRVGAPQNGAAVATVKYGTSSASVSVVPGSLPNGLGFGQGKAIVTDTDPYDDLFYIDTGQTLLSWIESMSAGASMGHSLFQFNINDVLTVTGIGFAIYYTSAEPRDYSVDLPPPVEIPAGQGLAWAYPQSVLASDEISQDPRGTSQGTAGAEIVFETFGLTAGQAPDDVTVPHNVLSSTDDLITLRMEAPELFGGDKREGGLEGEVRIYRGTQTQIADARLSQLIGVSMPEYRGLCYAAMGSSYLGNSNYLKNLNFILHRYPSNLGLGTGVTRLRGDANPAEIIYEAMTNTIWGLGLPEARFNLATFQAAAITLASEEMGMSLQWDTQKEAHDLIDDILRHIDGVLQTEPGTGLWTLKLIRAEAPALDLGENDQVEAPEFSRGSWDETWNDLSLTFIDGETFKQRTVTAQDSANQAVVGEVRNQSLEFLGFSKPAIAQRVAMRELKTHSYPFAKVRIKAKRKAWALRVGSPFTISWAPTGIASLALRVLSIDYGRLENGIIEVNAVEDAFAVAYSAFDAPQDSAWTDPLGDPEIADAQILVEAPFEWIENSTAEERVLAGATRGDSTSKGFEIWANEGAGYFLGNTGDRFAPSGLLAAAYSRKSSALDATGLTLELGRDLELVDGTDAAGRARGDCLLLFEDTGEICSFQTLTDNGDDTFTITNIVRGVYDTLPADHPAGTRAFIIRDAGVWFIFPYRDDDIGREITPALAFQNVGGIPSGEAFGVATVEIAGDLRNAGGIASEETFGTAIVHGGTGQPLANAGGIPSAEAFGIASLGPVISRILTSYTVSPVPCLHQPLGEFKIVLDPTIVRGNLGVASYAGAEFEIPDPGGYDSAIPATANIQQKFQRAANSGTGPTKHIYIEFETNASHGFVTGEEVWATTEPDTSHYSGYLGRIAVTSPTKFRIAYVNDIPPNRIQPWLSGHFYKVGARFFNGTAIYEAIAEGESGSYPPLVTDVLGSLAYDRDIIWQCIDKPPAFGSDLLVTNNRIYRGIFRKDYGSLGVQVYVIGVDLGVLDQDGQVSLTGVANSSFNGTFSPAYNYAPEPELAGRLVNYYQSGADAVSGGGQISAVKTFREVLYFVVLYDPQFAGGSVPGFCSQSQSKVGWPGYIFMGAIYANHVGGRNLVLPGGWPISQTWAVNY